MTVPVIDIGPFLDGSDVAGVAAQVARACEEIGFLTIVGHGVPASTIAAMRDASRAFFDQPMAVKATARRTNPDHNRGYFSFGEIALAKSLGQQTPPDLKEIFSIGPAAPPQGASGEAAAIHFAPNIWPDAFPALRPAFTAYFRRVVGPGVGRDGDLCAVAGRGPAFLCG